MGRQQQCEGSSNIVNALDFRDAHDKVDCREALRKRHDDN
jgi:hypothetical protein